jgi:hypothetical protein
MVKPWPGIVDIEPMPAQDDQEAPAPTVDGGATSTDDAAVADEGSASDESDGGSGHSEAATSPDHQEDAS